jgi:hypothetical protein
MNFEIKLTSDFSISIVVLNLQVQSRRFSAWAAIFENKISCYNELKFIDLLHIFSWDSIFFVWILKTKTTKEKDNEHLQFTLCSWCTSHSLSRKTLLSSTAFLVWTNLWLSTSLLHFFDIHSVIYHESESFWIFSLIQLLNSQVDSNLMFWKIERSSV